MVAKAVRELRISWISRFKDVLFITAGVFCAAFGFKSFILAAHFIDGGATGISLLISQLTNQPLFLLILIINIPFIWLAYKSVGHSFAIKTGIAILALAAILALVDFPEVTHDKLLIAAFGGFFLGAGIGLSVRGGAVIDGTEVLAIWLGRKTGATIGDIVIVINVVIFSTAAYFLSVESAMYSMITYLAASRTLDFIVEGIEEYIGVTIISSRSEEVIEMITHRMGRGVTIYGGKRGYGKTGERLDTEIVFTVITRLELAKLNTEILKIDPHSFVVMHSVKDTRGGVIKKRRLQEH